MLCLRTRMHAQRSLRSGPRQLCCCCCSARGSELVWLQCASRAVPVLEPNTFGKRLLMHSKPGCGLGLHQKRGASESQASACLCTPRQCGAQRTKLVPL